MIGMSNRITLSKKTGKMGMIILIPVFVLFFHGYTEAQTMKIIDTNSDNKKMQGAERTVTGIANPYGTQITTTTRRDSDGDGVYDNEDLHPTINEYFIVKDDNLNGIDDRYEQ
jgi:hypothetical protein